MNKRRIMICGFTKTSGPTAVLGKLPWVAVAMVLPLWIGTASAVCGDQEHEGAERGNQLGEIPAHVRQVVEGKLPGGYSVSEVNDRVPDGPNPIISMAASGADPDMDYWRARAMIESNLRVDRGAGLLRSVELSETEPNDSIAIANEIPGFGTGPGDDPEAIVSGSIDAGGDVDIFAIDLEVGDLVGMGVTGGAEQVELFDPSGALRHGSDQNFGFFYPSASLLPTSGNAVAAYVAEEAGTWYVSVSGGSDAYTLNIRLFTSSSGCQKIFLDFDGPTINPSIFGGIPEDVTLSPMADFLFAWGLDVGDESALIDRILEVLEENILTDMIDRGLNPLFDIEILNSRDHPGSFGDPDVSRVIVGGTNDEVQIGIGGVIAQAQSVDPGNFESEEDSIILLDLMSSLCCDTSSLNSYGVNPPVTKIDLVATGIGNFAAHQAGHLLGNFHTSRFSDAPNIQDARVKILVGAGDDDILGTDDDIDVDFGVDEYSPLEGFTGMQDTLNTIALTISSDQIIFQDGFESGDVSSWSSSSPHHLTRLE